MNDILAIMAFVVCVFLLVVGLTMLKIIKYVKHNKPPKLCSKDDTVWEQIECKQKWKKYMDDFNEIWQ